MYLKGFATRLHITFDDDGETRILTAPLYYYGSFFENVPIVVPVGFRTDFASIPRYLWSILSPFGRYNRAAVLHDFLYADNYADKKYCDLIFKEAMEILKVKKWKIKTMYYGVKWFGGFAWRKHRRNDKQII